MRAGSKLDRIIGEEFARYKDTQKQLLQALDLLFKERDALVAELAKHGIAHPYKANDCCQDATEQQNDDRTEPLSRLNQNVQLRRL